MLHTERVRNDEQLFRASKQRVGEGDVVGNLWDIDHHVSSSVNAFGQVFSPMNLKRLAIVFGHKKQGKFQLLFFLMKLLQRLNEPVVHVFGQLHHPARVRRRSPHGPKT